MKKSFRPVLGLLLFAALLIGVKLVYDNLSSPDQTGPLTTAGSTNTTGNPGTQPSGDAGSTAASTTPTAERTKLPDFQVTDEAGNVYPISSFFGKKLVINVWASWCGPCKAEMPEFLELDKAMADDGETMIIMINLTTGLETKKTALEYLTANDMDFKFMFYDETQSAAANLAIRVIPTTVFVDKAGYIHRYNEGVLTKAKVTEILKEMD